MQPDADDSLRADDAGRVPSPRAPGSTGTLERALRDAGNLPEIPPDARRTLDLGDGSPFDDLHLEAQLVLENNPEPRNVLDVAVALEAAGYIDDVARRQGFDNLFHMAEAVFELIDLYFTPELAEIETPQSWFRHTISAYLRGSWYAVPWMLSITVLFVGQFSLWSSLRATPDVATPVSLAFFQSACLAGIFSQMLSRKGLFYFMQGNLPLVGWVLRRFLIYGIPTIILVIGMVYSLVIVRGFSAHYAFIYLEFSFVIVLFMLSSAPLYMMRKFRDLTIGSALAMAVSFAIAEIFGISQDSIRRASLIGLSVAAGAMLMMTVSYLRVERTLREVRRSEVPPPDLRVAVSQLIPYGLYGLGYFALILSDRISVGITYGNELGLRHYYYPSSYEGSVDIAVLVLVPVMGILFAMVDRFNNHLPATFSRHSIGQEAQIRREMLRFFWKSIALVGASALAFGLILVPVGEALLPASYFAQSTVLYTIRVAVVGYGIIAIGMLCSQYLFFLNKWGGPVAGVLAGTAVDIVLGSAVSRHAGLYAGCWGLCAGGVVFSAITLFEAWKCFSRPEESIFAAF